MELAGACSCVNLMQSYTVSLDILQVLLLSLSTWFVAKCKGFDVKSKSPPRLQ